MLEGNIQIPKEQNKVRLSYEFTHQTIHMLHARCFIQQYKQAHKSELTLENIETFF
jgi:hypothetical protein